MSAKDSGVLTFGILFWNAILTGYDAIVRKNRTFSEYRADMKVKQ